MRKLWIPLALAFVILVAGAFLVIRSLPDRGGGRAGLSSIEGRDPEAEAEPAASPGASAAAAEGEAPPDASSAEALAAAMAGEATLHGKVTDEDGKPLEGASLFLQVSVEGMFRGGGRGGMSFLRDRLLGKVDTGSEAALEGHRTQGDGTYAIRIASIPPGTYEVLAVHPEHSPMGEAWTWTAESTEINFRLPAGDAITGVVYDPEGKPVGGAAVSARVDDDGGGFRRGFGSRGFVSKTLSADDGSFRLGVAPGTFHLEANAKGFAEGDLLGVPSGMQEVEILLEAAHGISGRVVDTSGAPIASAKVRVHRSQGGDRGDRGGDRGGERFGGRGGGPRLGRLFLPPAASVETGAEGEFSALDLAPGSYLVTVEKAGFVPEDAEAKLDEETAPEPLLLTMEDGKVLSGTVKDPKGNPVANAFVVVAEDRDRGRDREGRGGGEGREGRRGGGGPPDGPGGGRPGEEAQGGGRSEPEEPRRPEPHSPFEALAVAESDPSGSFSFDTLTAGKYSVSVQSNEFTVYRKDAIEVERPVSLDIVLDPGITLEGTVLSSAGGKPVARAMIAVEVDNDDRREIRSDEEGRYKLGGLFPGELERVVIDAKGYSLSLLEDIAVEKSPQVQALDFQLDEAGVLSGTVTDASGTGVFNARVTVIPDAGEEEGEGREMWRSRRRQMAQVAVGKTGPEGKFTIAQVNANPAVRITVDHHDFKQFRSDPFAVRPAEKREGLRYSLRSGGRVEVLVRDSGGVPYPGARVRLEVKPEETPAEEGRQGGFAGGAGPGGFGQGGFGGRGGGRGGRGAARGWSRTSGPDGKALFAGLDGGEYQISATVRGFRPYFAALNVAEEQTVPFVLDLGAESAIPGRVTDATGAPLAGVSIEATRAADGRFERGDARSAEDGSFRIGSLGDGPYSVRARLRGFAEKRLEGIEVDRNLDLVLEQLGAIAGNVVVAETGMPVTSFTIRLRPEGERRRGEEGAEGGRGRFGGAGGEGPGGRGGFGGGRGGGRGERRSFNDPAGAFLIENLTPGAYVLEVAAEGYSGVEMPVRVEEGQVTGGIVASLVEGLALTGLVQAKAGAFPLQGAQVFLLAMEGRPQGEEAERPQGSLEERRRARDEAAQTRREARRETRSSGVDSAESRLAAAAFRAASRGGRLVQTTDETGAFQLVDIPPGEYTLVVNHEAYIPARMPITVAADGVARFVRIDLEKGEELSGTITLSDGSAGAGANVFLRSTDGLTKRVMTDASGRYHVQGLLEGAYSFSARAGEGRRMPPMEITISKGTNRFDYKIEETTASR